MQNGIMDESPMRLPEASDVDQKLLAEEKARAKFAKSKEFKLLKTHLERRIEFYQSYLPGGTPVGTEIPTAEQWAVANLVIGECKLIIASFEQALDSVNAQR
jgi:hypothetical protein